MLGIEVLWSGWNAESKACPTSVGLYSQLTYCVELPETPIDGFGSKADMFNTSTLINSSRNSGQGTPTPAIERTRPLEAIDPAAEVAAYRQAIDAIANYAALQTDGGLVGQLLAEECE
jgi:hypothetical protein